MTKRMMDTGKPRFRHRSSGVTRMRTIRDGLGLSQLELALQVGITPNYFSQMERAPALMTDEVAERVAKALGCAVEDIRP